MASTIDQIDSYLKKNKKTLFNKLNEWYGRNKPIYDGKEFQQAFDDAKNLKYLWNRAQEAQGINSKIEAFNKLTTELDKWTDLEKLDDWEKQLEEQGLENWQVPEDKIEMDKMRLFGQLSNRPEINKFEDLNINDAWSQGYDYDQMKQLAADYGYNYQDESERKEFLDKLEEYHKQKNVEKAFALDKDAPFTDKLASVVTDFTMPISKEYAKRNYENINDLTDMKGALFGDALTNALMFGIPGKFLSNPTAKMVANNVTAPVMREAAQMAINDKSLQDAAVDAGGAIATNYATPYALRMPMRWAGRVTQGEVKQGAQNMVNAAANKARSINEKVMNGTPIVHVVERSDGTKTPYYFIVNKNGKLERVADHIARKAKNGETVSWKDYKEWKDIGFTNRSANIHKLDKLPVEDEQRIFDQMKEGAKKAAQNDLDGKPWNYDLNAIEAAGAANIKPIETKWNWIKSNPAVNDVQEYITNYQGQSRYATPMLNAVTQVLGPAGEVLQIEKDQKLTPQEQTEIELFRRLSDLSKKSNYSKYVKKPKLPEKFKKFKNDPTIVEIFGRQEED